MSSLSHLYDSDFYAWTNEQTALLRAGRLEDMDLEHIAEEIESMGKAEKHELVSRLKVLLMHLLKWQFQPTGRSTSWRLTIEEQRHEVTDYLADNPSLKAILTELIANAYGSAILAAARETGLDRDAFPPASPWSFEQITDGGFWPEDEGSGQR